MPDVYIEAQYQDSFVLREDDADVSPYDPTRNVFHAILTDAPVPEHGPMVRFSLVCGHWVYSIDWTRLPDNARPIRFRQMSQVLTTDGTPSDSQPHCDGIDFGFQFNDETGANRQEVVYIELSKAPVPT